jgi:hypothetical protein
MTVNVSVVIFERLALELTMTYIAANYINTLLVIIVHCYTAAHRNISILHIKLVHRCSLHVQTTVGYIIRRLPTTLYTAAYYIHTLFLY